MPQSFHSNTTMPATNATVPHGSENTPSNPSDSSQRYFSGWMLTPMRLFLGFTFVYAGLQKLTDSQFFQRSTPRYIGNQIIGFAHGTPLHDFLLHVALPHAMIFGWLVIIGEIAIGLGALFGLLLRPAAFFGVVLSILFFLSASWHSNPYFYGSDIVFVFCWLTLLLTGPLNTGLPTIDSWLLHNLFSGALIYPRNVLTRLVALLLGGPAFNRSVMTVQETTKHYQGQNTKHLTAHQRNYTLVQRTRERRRNFLSGALTGGVAAFGITFLISLLRPGSGNTNDQTNTGTADQPSPQVTGSAVAGSGTVIARVSAVAKNNATTFTLPGSGDPGVLIHLSNDQFVAYDATCTHDGCEVGYDPASQHLICPCHGATFDPANAAAVLDGPTQTPLTSVKIQVDSATGTISLSA